jgi:hypothetical protein
VQSGATVKVANNDLRPKQIQSNATSGILQIAGPAAASTRVMTTPDANFTAARTDAANSFTGDQTLSTGKLIVGTSGKGATTSGAINLGLGTNGSVNGLILNNSTGAREFYNSYTGSGIVNQGEGAFSWANVSTTTVNLATLFPELTFTNAGISVFLQISTGLNSSSGSSILYHMNRTTGGTWSAASISAIGGGVTVTSSSGSGASITLNFSNSNLYGTAIVRVLVTL